MYLIVTRFLHACPCFDSWRPDQSRLFSNTEFWGFVLIHLFCMLHSTPLHLINGSILPTNLDRWNISEKPFVQTCGASYLFCTLAIVPIVCRKSGILLGGLSKFLPWGLCWFSMSCFSCHGDFATGIKKLCHDFRVACVTKSGQSFEGQARGALHCCVALLM